MTESAADQPSSTFLDLPAWMPQAAANQARRIAEQDLFTHPEEFEMFIRLSTDPRMQNVWKELSRRSRQTGEFLNPAKKPPTKPELTTQDAFQADAIGFMFFYTFCAGRDKIAVSKPEDGRRLRVDLENRARLLREVADELEAEKNTSKSAEIAALRRVAGWQDDRIKSIRPETDPLSIKNDRGDRTVRGVQILIAAMLQDTFGKPLHGLAATLTAVALATETSERVTRSAFSRRKAPQRS